MGSSLIHPSAIVSPNAILGEGVVIGPFAIVGDNVTIGDRTRIGAHCVLEGPTRIGTDNVFFPFGSIGLAPQDLKFGGEDTELHIGSHNQLREYVTLHRGTVGGGGVTRIGNHNLLMISTHVAHDCIIGNHNILANNATLAGHVTIEDYATVGALTPVHQFCRIGKHSFIGGASAVTKDTMPFSRNQGNHVRCFGENAIGLRRKGFPDETIRCIHRAYRLLMNSGLNTTQAVEAIRSKAELIADENVAYLVAFIESSTRGVAK